MEKVQVTKSELEILKQKRAAHLSAAAALESAIRILEGNPNKPIDWKNSAIDCLTLHGFPLRPIDILNCMAEKEPEKFKLKEFNKRRNYVNALSIALNNLCDNEHFIRMYVEGYKGFFYGPKEWFHPMEFPNIGVPQDHPPLRILLPEIDKKFYHALLADPNSVFRLRKTANNSNNDE